MSTVVCMLKDVAACVDNAKTRSFTANHSVIAFQDDILSLLCVAERGLPLLPGVSSAPSSRICIYSHSPICFIFSRHSYSFFPSWYLTLKLFILYY